MTATVSTVERAAHRPRLRRVDQVPLAALGHGDARGVAATLAAILAGQVILSPGSCCFLLWPRRNSSPVINPPPNVMTSTSHMGARTFGTHR